MSNAVGLKGFLKEVKITPMSRLASFDVKAVYPSIPVKKALEIVKDELEIRENLELVEAYKSRENIGVVIYLSGDMSYEIQHLSGKISKWINAIKQRILSAYDTILCINTTIMRTIEYPLLTTAFYETECNRLVKPIHDISLA